MRSLRRMHGTGGLVQIQKLAIQLVSLANLEWEKLLSIYQLNLNSCIPVSVDVIPSTAALQAERGISQRNASSKCEIPRHIGESVCLGDDSAGNPEFKHGATGASEFWSRLRGLSIREHELSSAPRKKKRLQPG